MPTPVIPDRETIVTIGEYLPVMTEPAVRHDRDHSEMARDSVLKQINVHHLPGIGWQLRGRSFDPSNVHERTIGATDAFTDANGKAQIAPNHEFVSIFRAVSDTGLTASGATASGDPMLTKMRGAGESWDQKLSYSIASPSTAEDTYPIDLVMIGTEDHRPTEQIHFKILVPGGFAELPGTIAEFCFCGPAGSDKDLVGNGQYCIKFFGDGKANLYERGYLPTDDTKALIWQLRWKRFEWSKKGVLNGLHWVSITSNSYVDAQGKYRGNKILINSNQIASGGSQLIEGMIGLAIASIKESAKYLIPTYTVPKVTDEATTLAPPRAGARRDIRMHVQIAKSSYPTTGELVDDVFSLEFAPTDVNNFEFEWYSHTPHGTAVDAKLYSVVQNAGEEFYTEVELTEVAGGFVDQYGGKKIYTPLPGCRHYRVRYFLTSPGASNPTVAAGETTPTVLAWRLLREPVIQTITGFDEVLELYPSGAGTKLIGTAVSSIDITGEGAEMNDEAAALIVHDLNNRYPGLAYPGRPIKIEITYETIEDPPLRSVLFNGEIENAPYVKRRMKSFPDARDYDIGCVGYFRRMSEQFAADRFNGWDRVADKPLKVTELIYLALRGCGVPVDELDIPDIPLRAFGINADELVWEPGSRLYDYALTFARDYFGAYIIRDHNAGANGMVRMLRPPADLNVPLARFTPNAPTGGTKLAHVSAGYGSTVISGQTVETTFIQRKTNLDNWNRPEGNMVIVLGAAATEAASKAGVANGAQLSQIAYNVKSYNFLNLAAAHANYPSPLDVTTEDGQNPHFLARVVPIWVMDATLSTQRAVDWVCRRMYQMACFPFVIKTFTAPLLLVTDVSDTLQTRPRKLRFYDKVEVWNTVTASWQKFLVRKVKPSYIKDGIQMAQYELFGGPLLDEFAMVADRSDYARYLHRVIQRNFGLSYRSNNQKASQHAMWNKQAWMNLPTIVAPPIQHLDPDEANFGELKWTMDFSPLG
jgi:hypothetical protein